MNPQPLTIDVEYEKVQMKHDFGSQEVYFNDNIDEHFTELLLD